MPAAVAVASICAISFPRPWWALINVTNGQVDLKLGIVMAASATVGGQAGIKIQELDSQQMGRSRLQPLRQRVLRGGLLVVGSYVFYDAWKKFKIRWWRPVPKLADVCNPSIYHL